MSKRLFTKNDANKRGELKAEGNKAWRDSKFLFPISYLEPGMFLKPNYYSFWVEEIIHTMKEEKGSSWEHKPP